MTQQNQQNELGYGIRLVNPEGFIWAVIRHFFSPINRNVDWQNIVHEARVALFEQDLRLGETVPETTSGYWWRVAAAVGVLLWEDYRIGNMFMSHMRKRPLSLTEAAEDDPETAAIYYEKQQREPDPANEVEAKEWFDHYMGLAEGVLLDNVDAQQGERDLTLFELWVGGYSPKEIAERPEVTWLNGRSSVDAALRRIISRLWEFFGVSLEEHVMVVGDHTSMPDRTGTGRSSDPKKSFQAWYADPANRERHQKRCREQIRQRRAEAKKTTE